MMKQFSCDIATILLIVMTSSAIGYSAQSEPPGGAPRPGQLKGMLLDEATRQPLQGAHVMIDGTVMGASTDASGGYAIGRIPPGIYNVRFVMLGYETRHVNSVVVNPGRTAWQQVELKSTVLQGKGVTVTAGYFQAARDAVVSSRSMDFEELRSDPGCAEDIQRSMQALPSVVSGEDGSNEIIVRGGIPGENLFLLDGIEISNPNHFSEQGAGGGPINLLNPYFVQRVDFYAGAFPACYGDKASSVMDITLREGSRDRRTGYATLGMSGAGLMAEGPIDHGKGSFLVSARKSYLELILGSIGMEAVPRYYDLQTKIVYDLNRSNKLFFDGAYGADFIEGRDEDTDDIRNPEHYDWRWRGDQQIYGMGWRRLLGAKGYTRLILSQVTSRWNQKETKNDSPYWRNHSTESEPTLKADLVFLPRRNLEMQFGAQIKNPRFDLVKRAESDTLFQYTANGFGGFSISDTVRISEPYSQDHNGRSMKTAAYMQWKWRPAARWTLTAGLRGDRFEYIRGGAVDPRLGASFGLNASTHVNLAAGQQSQAPNYSEVTANPLNRDLAYKRTRQVVFGMDRLFREDVRGTVEFFYKDYQRVPIGTSEMSPDPIEHDDGRLTGRGEGFARGAEIFLQKKPTGSSQFTVSYAYSVSRARDPRNGRMVDWDYDYRHIFTAIGGVQLHLKDKDWYRRLNRNWIYKAVGWILPLGDETGISFRWRYLGGRPYTQPVYHPELQRWLTDESTALNADRYPAYHRLDLRIDSRYFLDGWNIVAFLDFMNVYNRKNVWEYFYKKNGSIGTVNQYSFLPVGGVTVEF
jgi:hypothetical protein